MATLGDPKYDLQLKYQIEGTTSSKTKTLSTINYTTDSSQSGTNAYGATPTVLQDFASLILDSVIGGTSTEPFVLIDSRQIIGGE